MIEAPLISGKALWSVVCGTNILPSDEVVGEELEVATPNLKAGLLYFEPYSQTNHDKWVSSVKLKDNQKSFVARLGKMLNLCSSQTWSFFQLYLQQEYRGSCKELLSALSSFRTESRLLHNIYQFYLTDPMHLLSCRMHLLASATKRKHPYQKLFSVYLKDVLDPDHTLGSNIVRELQRVHDCITCHQDRSDQLALFADPDAPTTSPSALDFVPGNPDLPENAEFQWLAGRLALAKHLLATLLVYYAAPTRTCPPDTVYTLLNLAQGNGVCGSAMLSGACNSAITSLLHDIQALHSILLTMVINAEADTKSHSLCEAAWRDKCDPLMSTLGSRPSHLPPLLAWSLVQAAEGAASSAGDTPGSTFVQQYSKMAQRALQGGVMPYLHTVLNNQAIQSDSVVHDVCRSVVYALLCVTGCRLHLDDYSAGPVTPCVLATQCLECPLPAQLFWMEDGGGAGLLLPDALSAFPAQPGPLLALCRALATAGPDSCGKVVELLSELPSVTWSVSDRTLAGCCSEVGGAQLITHSPLPLLDGFSLPPHTSGNLLVSSLNEATTAGHFTVQWHYPTNAWQLILAALHALDEQLSSGLAVSEWLVEFVEESLELVASIVSCSEEHLSSLTHVIEQSLTLMVRLSSVLEPKYSLVKSLLRVASAVSQHTPDFVWSKLSNCGLLPALPSRTSSRRESENVAQYYRCGTLRRIVCGDEAACGTYPALRSYTAMLSSALRSALAHNPSVRGGVVFVVREVLPALTLQWTYASAKEKALVLESIMSVIHHALEPGKADEDIATEVGVQVTSGGGGRTLRCVLEAGATLEGALDAPPAQWPHATHATALARTAQLALSILHRLVLVYCSGADAGPDKQRLRDFLAGEKRPLPASGVVTLIGQGPAHLALTVAQYVHHRLNSRIPYLSLRILTKLAQELGVPLVACLGSEAEVIRELLLNRLDAATEDTRVKVSISRLLTAAVSSQPGLLRAFLSPPDSLMTSLTQQLDIHSKSIETSSVELVGSIVELVGALWAAGHASAIATLRLNKDFWTVLLRPLHSKPDTAEPTVLHHTLRLVALEHFVAHKDHQGKLAAGLTDALKISLFKNFTILAKHTETLCSEGDVTEERVDLIRDWRDLIVVLLAAYPASLSADNISVLWSSTITAVIACLSCPEEPLMRQAAHLLSDIMLSLHTHSLKSVCSLKGYWEAWGGTVEALRAGLLQTPAPTQLRIITALLLALQHDQHNADDLTSVLCGVRTILEQHCSLASAVTTETEQHFCSNAAVLQVACSALHHCLLQLPLQTSDDMLQQTHVVPALLHATTLHMQGPVAATVTGGESVICSMVRLLSLLSRRPASGQQLSCQALATSLALTLSSQQYLSGGDNSSLAQVLQCAVSCITREGVTGIDGCVALVAIHLTTMVEALASPQHQPDVAYGSAALVTALAPHHRLWVAKHPHSYTTLVQATAACLHMTTHLVRLKGALPHGGASKSSSSLTSAAQDKTTDKSKEALTPSQELLLKKLLRILLSCLRAVRMLGPDLVELVCRPSCDVREWLPALLQPSFRRATQADHTQPNLATLTALLDLCTAHLLKDKSQPTDCGREWRRLLAACGEQALLILLSQTALFIMNPETSSREARDIRTWLNDDLNTFFSQWLGRRPSSAASAGEGAMDRQFLRLIHHLTGTLCQHA